MFKHRSVSKTLSTSNQDLYVVPPQWQADIQSIMIANTSSSDATVSLDWYDNETTTYHTLAEQIKMPANSMIQITDCLWLVKNDKIRGLASDNSVVEVTLKVSEQLLGGI